MSERELSDAQIVNLTQDVGKVGAARVHEMGGSTLTIFKNRELFEFARRIISADRARTAAAGSPEVSPEPVSHLSRSDALNLLADVTPYGTEDADRTSCAVTAIVMAFEFGQRLSAHPPAEAVEPAALAPLRRIEKSLIRMGAQLPIEIKGTIESSIQTGHSHALLLVQDEIEAILKEQGK